jgi:hypothetical protein
MVNMPNMNLVVRICKGYNLGAFYTKKVEINVEMMQAVDECMSSTTNNNNNNNNVIKSKNLPNQLKNHHSKCGCLPMAHGYHKMRDPLYIVLHILEVGGSIIN